MSSEAGPEPAQDDGTPDATTPPGGPGALPAAGEPSQFLIAPNGVINLGPVHGGQRLGNHGIPGGRSNDGRVQPREGPISSEEITRAGAGFAEPAWFPEALAELGSRVLFLTGPQGTGRRTAALNLLTRRSGSLVLHAVDSDVDLAEWRPDNSEVRGYLVDGLRLHQPPKRMVLERLRAQLRKTQAYMVIVLSGGPELAGELRRELDITPVLCEPPPPRAVFDARLEHAVPNAAERARLHAALAPGLLEELLVPELVPAQVAELVAELASGHTDADALRERLSFLAAEEAPRLLHDLREDADSLAFLLATCVFEGLDHRLVREEANRLLRLADGRLDSELVGSEAEERSRPNPEFVFRKSLTDLLRDIGARRHPPEIQSSSGYDYTAEPVRFTRHRRADVVLRHVWREYGHMSRLLTDWLKSVPAEDDLVHPVGRVMGMAARWGGGRGALAHIGELALHDRRTTRGIAAYALGRAAEDPVLAGEVRHRLYGWSNAKSWQLRSTVAYACATEFGVSRPAQALRLLRRLGRDRAQDDAHEGTVAQAVRNALITLSLSGNQPAVFECLAAWAEDRSEDGALALRAFQDLLTFDARWFADQLLGAGDVPEAPERITGLIRRTLNDDSLFPDTASVLLAWCTQGALGDDRRGAAVEALLTALARVVRHGELRLFVLIDESDERHDVRLAGGDIAREALNTWRYGRTA
ncbi:hypothetical protein [Streptomyces johnsoniae]|uniref:Uncharacterized protein n=1 Tax=Streptomyces johnsoniae TaxID=3075532 RepID=A0ABU2SH15_9ACTN|nr:hypothetical protein [Streptomyces sp. DSM 41886]MDT0447060.1 hypothetical protein [Streptomyces sp. DSM 41886]